MAATTDDEGHVVALGDILTDRELEWAALPHTTRKGSLPYLSARETLSLDSAITNHEARPHLVKAYKDLVSPGFNQHVYTDKEDYRALRYVIARGIDLRGFRLEVEGEKGSGRILARLMGCNLSWT